MISQDLYSWNRWSHTKWEKTFYWCEFINVSFLTLMSLVLIVALLWRRESRCDLRLLTIPAFTLVPNALRIPVCGPFMFGWKEYIDAYRVLLRPLNHTKGMKYMPHLIFPVILF